MRISSAAIATALLALVLASPARAQVVPASPGAWSVDGAGAFLSEAWDYNLSREVLWGGWLDLRRRVARAWTIGGEIDSFAVRQQGADGVVVGAGPSIGWTANPSARSRLFVDVGLGLSHASVRVPPRGTRVNYLVRMTGGFSHPLSSRLAAAVSLTWIHLSNASREGRDRNPDIQAVGLSVSVSRAF